MLSLFQSVAIAVVYISTQLLTTSDFMNINCHWTHRYWQAHQGAHT